MIKVYALINYQSLTTSFMVNGKQVYVDFEGGTRHGLTTRGMLSTGDEKLQEAIEKDAAYGKEFKLDEARTRMANSEEVETVKKPTKVENTNTVIDGINNAQEAKEYLLNTYTELTPDDVANVDKVKLVMSDKGIEFSPYRPR